MTSRPFCVVALFLLLFPLLLSCREDGNQTIDDRNIIVDPPPDDGKKKTETTPVVDMSPASLKTIGVTLDPDFEDNGNFQVQMLIEGMETGTPALTSDVQALTPPMDWSTKSLPEKAAASIEEVSCEISGGVAECECDKTTVAGTPPTAKPLDVAIDIDSSGSNMRDHEDKLASDPGNLRLKAASGIVDTLLTGEHRLAAFDFGTRYCSSLSDFPCTDGSAESAFYSGLTRLGTKTYMFADFTDNGGKETLKEMILKAVWHYNNATPLYDSLLEVMSHMKSTITRDSSKMIIVFSDGEPLDNWYTEADVCRSASSKQVKIMPVGYGYASIHDPRKELGAVTVLQNLATCSGGSYLAIEDTATIGEKTKEMSRGLTEGHLDTTCTLDPSKVAALDPTTPVVGKVKVTFVETTAPKEAIFSLLPTGRPAAPTLRMQPEDSAGLN